MHTFHFWIHVADDDAEVCRVWPIHQRSSKKRSKAKHIIYAFNMGYNRMLLAVVLLCLHNVHYIWIWWLLYAVWCVAARMVLALALAFGFRILVVVSVLPLLSALSFFGFKINDWPYYMYNLVNAANMLKEKSLDTFMALWKEMMKWRSGIVVIVVVLSYVLRSRFIVDINSFQLEGFIAASYS